jgi:hypothetical protein
MLIDPHLDAPPMGAVGVHHKRQQLAREVSLADHPPTLSRAVGKGVTGAGKQSTYSSSSSRGGNKGSRTSTTAVKEVITP